MSDSCTAAGNHATPFAACACTGVGEDIVDGGLAVRIVAAVEEGIPIEDAARALEARMRARAWNAGFIALDARGRWAVGRTVEHIAWRARWEDGERGFEDA